MTHTLLTIRRGSINDAARRVAKLFPGSSVTGYFVGGKPVSRRGMLVTPEGVDVTIVKTAAGLN